jgi:hypothetical protein
LEIKGSEACVEKLVSDEIDAWIIDAAARNSQEEQVDEVYSVRVREGWAGRDTRGFLLAHPGGARNLPLQMGIRISQQPPDRGKQSAFSRTEEAVVTDLHKALRQDVLQEAADELLRAQCAELGVSAAGIFV